MDIKRCIAAKIWAEYLEPEARAKANGPDLKCGPFEKSLELACAGHEVMPRPY